MKKGTLRNIVVNGCKRGIPSVLFRKIKDRCFGRCSAKELAATIDWCASVCDDWDHTARAWDEALWQESITFAQKLQERAKTVLGPLDVTLGGGAHYPLLYFLTRHAHPSVIVETGVAAGFSSQAFLEAIHINQKGRLYSSDFPYVRLKNPESYIGMMVEDHLKISWELSLAGDRCNIPTILDHIGSARIDIFHYDSDKCFSQRDWVMQRIAPYLHDQSLIVMDDIQDNRFFRDCVLCQQRPWKVFSFQDKYVGVIGIGDTR